MTLLFLSIAFTVGTAFAAEKTTFQAKPVMQYPHRQSSENVTIAVEQFITDEQAREAFGKNNPWRSGVLPVLVVIRNDGPAAIRVDRIRFVYVLPDRTRIDSTPAADLRFLKGAKQPNAGPGFPKVPGITGKPPKNPLAEWELEGRAFAAKMIPPGQSASGFVYFQAPATSEAASIYISGLANAVSGTELYYFEIPLSGPLPGQP